MCANRACRTPRGSAIRRKREKEDGGGRKIYLRVSKRERERERERERDITVQTARHRDAATGTDWTVIAFWVRLIDMGTGGWVEGRAAASTLKPCLRRGLGMRER